MVAVARPLSVRPLILAALATIWLLLNLIVLLPWVWYPAGDWGLMAEAVARMQAGQSPYADPRYIYPPLTTWLLGGLIPLGFPAMVAAHFGALWLLRDRLLWIVALGSAPFWFDTALGNFTTFFAVAGVLALRGNRYATWAFLVMFALMPKILFAPLGLWLVWKRPELRLPAVVIGVVVLAGNLATGMLGEWLPAALAVSGDPEFRAWDFGPTRFLGSTWLLVGLPLGAWLTWRGHVGWAGAAVAPYLPPPYLLVLLLELAADGGRDAGEAAHEVERPVVARLGVEPDGAHGQAQVGGG